MVYSTCSILKEENEEIVNANYNAIEEAETYEKIIKEFGQ